MKLLLCIKTELKLTITFPSMKHNNKYSLDLQKMNHHTTLTIFTSGFQNLSKEVLSSNVGCREKKNTLCGRLAPSHDEPRQHADSGDVMRHTENINSQSHKSYKNIIAD